VATHPSDFAVALTALDAVVRVKGPHGERDIPITQFFLQPGETPERETSLEKGELIVAVKLPHTPSSSRSLYLKVRDRQSFEFALASAAVAAEMRDGVMTGVRIAMGGVGTVPWRAPEAEALLEGKAPTVLNFVAAAEAALASARPLRHNAFKLALAGNTLVAALKAVTGVS
jgi:xanthine dehydrogenase YagS FAD-binding subunit